MPDDDEFEEIEIGDEPIQVEGFQKYFAVSCFKTCKGLEVIGLIEIGNKES